MFAVAASPTALSAVRGTVRVQRPARDTRHHGRSARLPAVRSRASAQGVDNPATPGDATEPPVSRRWLGAAALSVAVNVSVGAGAARAFGSGVPGYDIDQAARQRALDAIKRENAEQREIARQYKEARRAEAAAAEAAMGKQSEAAAGGAPPAAE